MRGLRLTPTRLGGRGGVLFAGFAIAWLATPHNNAFFALLAWCGALAAIGAVGAVRNVAGVTIARCTARPGPAAAASELQIVLAGCRRRDLVVAIELDAGWVEVARCPAVDRETVLAATLPPRRRGIRRLRRCRIESDWPFGLFRARALLTIDAEVVTWPAPGPLRRTPPAAARRGQRDDRIAGLRPFRQGDSPRDMHWKATARRGEPIVREHELVDPIDLEVDRRCDGDELERRLSAAATAVLQAAAEQRPVRLRSQDYKSATNAHTGADELLRWLAGATALDAAGGRTPS
jgi:uncharacterized protein (DUF58 family)